MRLTGPVVAAALVLGAAVPAHATLVLPMSLEQLSEEASVVVHGRVTNRWSAWDDAHRRIWTYTQIEPVEVWRGDAGTGLVVRTIGGQVGEIGMQVAGTPQLVPGEEFVLFLEDRDGPGPGMGIVGFAQGAFRIQREPAGLLAVPLMDGVALVGTLDAGTPVVQMAFEELRSAVRGALSAEPAASPQVPSVPETPAVPPPPQPFGR